jgi:myo-inositol-1(or 4)-monophosphatase
MNDQTLDALLGFAQDLGHEAGRQLLAWRGRAGSSLKRDGTVVTDADRAVDRWLCQAIRGRFPDHGILSEEADTAYAGRPLTWVIDPLDGTTNFALGICYWGCSIAVVSHGEPVVGVLAMPELRALFWATHEGGAFMDGERLGGPARGVSEANSFLALCSRSLRYLELPMPQKGRLLGSAAYDLAAVAQGIAVGVTQVSPHIWDIAAGWLLLREAGRAVGPLLPGVPDPFPMVPGVDYEDRIFPLAAGADGAVLHKIQRVVRIKPEHADRISAWAAAGWRMVRG